MDLAIPVALGLALFGYLWVRWAVHEIHVYRRWKGASKQLREEGRQR